MTTKFQPIESHVVPLAAENVDTDQIIPARFLKVTDKHGLGEKLFFDWRYLADGSPNPKFVINEPASKGAQVLLAGDNFGCGSSREHAPWALVGWGLRAVISTSFADIFKGNSLKNGLLPVVVDAATHAKLSAAVKANRAAKVRIDLGSDTLTLPDGSSVKFTVDDFAKHCLLNGVDELGYLQSFEEKIRAHELKHEKRA
ncbi:MAG: 3-isopropylmalate dehydratase small subunit [Myxococcales bacterium]|nr:3-isopropylmalate dehydratase small subunit [Myxococcales bacterium]